MRAALFTFAILLATTTLVADKAKAQPDTGSIQGRWRPLSVTKNGEKTTKRDLTKSSITFSGDYFFVFGKRTLRGKFELDPTTNPQQIDLKFQGENDASRVVKGIFRFVGDKLTVCTAADPRGQRPADFTSVAGAKRTLLMLERMPGIIGRWERHVKNAEGQLHRIVKEHQAGKTTLTVYDEAGAVVHQHQSNYKLSQSGEVRIFTFFDIELTAGAGEGRNRFDRESYAYRVNGDFFYEFRGVVLSDKTPPGIRVWKRVKERR